MELNSPRWPLLGIALVWTFYACFSILRAPAPQEPAVPQERSVPPHSHVIPAKVTPDDDRGPPGSESADHDKGKGAEREPDPAPATKAPVEGKPEVELSAEDKELLAIVSGPNKPETLERLEAFVAEHPDHAIARGVLITRLLSQQADDWAIRPHVAALQELMPGFGLPDLFMARLEMLAGREEYARALLLDAVEKDLTWFPDDEVFRMKISSELTSGASPLTVLTTAMSMELPFCRVARDLARQFLPSDDTKDGAGRSAAVDPRVRWETARAVLRFGEAMQEHGTLLIENLVGSAVVGLSGKELTKTGGLAPEDVAILRRSHAIRGEARIAARLTEEILLTKPDLMSRYLENIVAHGELRAARRGFMDYLSAQGRE